MTGRVTPLLDAAQDRRRHYRPQHDDRDHQYRKDDTFQRSIGIMLLQLGISPGSR